MTASRRVASVCVYCGSSDAADPAFIEVAATLGRLLAESGVRLVYGGGGVGLMGATARAAHAAGGRVLGVMPEFLRSREILFDDVETVVVRTMHERKMIMFEQSDAFIVLPGGVGTLEEVVELLSWRRLGLHAKPVAFLNLKSFWEPFFRLIDHTIEAKLTPASFREAYVACERVENLIPELERAAAAAATSASA